MEKPITIMKNEFDEALVKLVNESGLPAFILKPSVERMLQLLEQLEARQIEQDKKAWEEEQARQEKKIQDAKKSWKLCSENICSGR